MVQKYQSTVRIYKHPFELVMAAYERRFPRCPQMPIVLDCQIIADESSDDGAKRKTSRRCKLVVDAPYLFKKVIGLDVCYFLQHNSLDMKARTLMIEATNETYSSRIEIVEICRYYVHPENPEWTCFDQTATLDIKNFFGFENSMEKLGMKQYTQTTLKGKEIIEYFVAELQSEGVEHIERWRSPNNETTTSVEELQQIQINSIETMLDADYIEKFLGTMNPLQESKLLELRRMLEKLNIEKIPNYPTLLRFLRARDFNVERSFAMLQESMKWRLENDVDKLLTDYCMPSVISKHFPGGWHHYDNEGRPLYILRLGHMDVKGLLKSIGEDGLLKLTLHVCEEGLKLMEESTIHRNKPVWTWCLLVDLDGLSMRHLWRPGIKALLRIIETVEKNYPETMGRVLVVRAPRVFPILWTLVSTFIDDNTRSKFLFYGGPNCLHPDDGLVNYLPEEVIPDFIGGTSKTLVHEGGLVPKTLYKTTPDSGEVIQKDENSLYNSITLKPTQIHEVFIKNTDPKSVLTWDFDVQKCDLHFTVYRTSLDVQNTVKSDASTSVFDFKQFEDGTNYTKAEATLVCRSKESVQGSHVMSHADTYVLQWTCLPSIDNEIAQLMYFYETLSSINYKGSMTSLQSGFSALSVASSCQSR